MENKISGSGQDIYAIDFYYYYPQDIKYYNALKNKINQKRQWDIDLSTGNTWTVTLPCIILVGWRKFVPEFWLPIIKKMSREPSLLFLFQDPQSAVEKIGEPYMKSKNVLTTFSQQTEVINLPLNTKETEPIGNLSSFNWHLLLCCISTSKHQISQPTECEIISELISPAEWNPQATTLTYHY